MPETETNAKTFVDTNILFYAIDTDAGQKHERARDDVGRLWETETGIVSTQVLSEFAVNLRAKKKLQWNDIGRILAPYLAWRVITPDAGASIEIIRIADRHRLSYWDAAIVHSAVNGGAATLHTKDLNDGQMIEGVRIVNPLR